MHKAKDHLCLCFSSVNLDIIKPMTANLQILAENFLLSNLRYCCLFYFVFPILTENEKLLSFIPPIDIQMQVCIVTITKNNYKKQPNWITRLRRITKTQLYKTLSVTCRIAILVHESLSVIQLDILQLYISGTETFRPIMNSMIHVIPLHSLNWSIHTKDESKRGTAFAFIFGVN